MIIADDYDVPVCVSSTVNESFVQSSLKGKLKNRVNDKLNGNKMKFRYKNLWACFIKKVISKFSFKAY